MAATYFYTLVCQALLVCIFIVAIGHARGSGEAELGRPNVLFLVVDDLRPRLACYGDNKMITPNIDQLAASSLRFDRAYVQQALCSPSRTSFLTGRRPDSTRIFDLIHYFRDLAGNYTTLPQHFKNNGYLTQSVGKIYHPGTASGNTDDYPYSWTYPAFHAPTQKYTGMKICPQSGGSLSHSAVCPVDLKTVPGGSLPDIQNTDFSIQFLHNRSVDRQPFFLGLGYHRPHLPFAYPKDYQDLYPLSKVDLSPDPFIPPWLPEVAWTPWDELRSYDDVGAMNLSYPFGAVPISFQYKLIQSYSAATSYLDAQVGRILRALDQLGLANNTIITFHGDHGWQLGDHGEWCKHTNFDIATRIPLMVYVPGVTAYLGPPGKNFQFLDVLDKNSKFWLDAKRLTADRGLKLSTDALVEAVDLYATISELARLPIPPTCPENPFNVTFCTEGTSLVPLFKSLTLTAENNAKQLFVSGNVLRKGTSKGQENFMWKSAVFSQYPRPSVHPGNTSINPVLEEIRIMGYTMRTVNYRYTEWVAYNHSTFMANWQQVYARELYVYNSDPLEDVNVAKVEAYRSLVASLSKQLRDGWRKALPEAG